MIKSPNTKHEKLLNFIKMAEIVAQNSPDDQTKVGSLLIDLKENSVVATGYNGFVSGANDNALPKTRPDKYEFMIHSEANTIYNCAKQGISTKDRYLVCLKSPCKQCTRTLYACGVNIIIAKELYSDFEEVSKLKDIKIDYALHESQKYYIINLNKWENN